MTSARERSSATGDEHQHQHQQPSLARTTRTGGLVHTAGKLACYLAPVAGLLAAGKLTRGTSGLLMVAVLVIIATPVIAFTRNQIALAEKGRRLARTVADVRSLMEADAAAFTSLLTGRHYLAPDRAPALAGAPPALTDAQAALADAPAGYGRYCPHGCAPDAAAGAPIPRDASPASFWASLTGPERSWLLTAAHTGSFPAGSLICQQEELARHVWIIMSGQVAVYVVAADGQRCVALREAGDIIGERAAIEVRSRSATVVTLVPVRALAVTTSSFAAFIDRHPRVLAVLERQVYDRLVEDRPGPPMEYLAGITPAHPPWNGLNCSIFMADIAAFGDHCRNDKDRQFLRALMYAILRRAFEGSSVSWHDCYREDRGDGVLIIVPPSTPTSQLIDPLSEFIAAALAVHNDRAAQSLRIQLRVAIHVGPVVLDAEGVCGESVILAARILDAPMLKRQLVQEVADLGFIVSTYVYDTVVKHAPGRINPARYRRIRVRVKEARLDAWVCTLGIRNVTPDTSLTSFPLVSCPLGLTR